MTFWIGFAVGWLTCGPVILLALALAAISDDHDD